MQKDTFENYFEDNTKLRSELTINPKKEANKIYSIIIILYMRYYLPDMFESPRIKLIEEICRSKDCKIV